MKPETISATAIQVAHACPARYQAEHLVRGRTTGQTAATLGSAVHGALEMYVKGCYLDMAHQPGLQLLIDLFKMSYMTQYGTADTDTEEFADGVEMLKGWFKRTDFTNVRVISCEVKENFMVPWPGGEIKFNYIWDRFDDLGAGKLKVVDYKTNRWAVSHDDLKKKIQARCYGLAGAIKAKQQGLTANEIWVEFDMLRHTPVGIVFTREDNAATWRFLQEEAQRIWDTPDDNPPETPNSECRFCVRKVSCAALKRNVTAGGILGYSFEEIIDARANMNYQLKGLESAIAELDNFIETEARERDLEDYTTKDTKLTFSVSKRRAVDGERVSRVVGDAIFQQYGGMSIGVTKFDAMLKDSRLTDQQRDVLKSMVFTNYGEPRVRTEPTNPIDGD